MDQNPPDSGDSKIFKFPTTQSISNSSTILWIPSIVMTATLLSTNFPCQQVLRQLCKSGIPSSNNVWGWGGCGGGSPHHPHGNPRWVRGGRRGLQKAAKAQQGDQRQLGQAFDPETGPKTIPPASQRESDSRDIEEYVQRWYGCHLWNRITHHSSKFYLPVQTTKCNLCHKSRHGVIVFKFESKKWM